MALTEVLRQYGNEAISLHVPGHHNGTIGNLDLELSYDSTEISGLDDYHHPEGIIKDAEIQLSRHDDYESKFLVGGTTAGILSVIHAANGRLAVMRNAHKSVFNALDLIRGSAYILPTVTSHKTNQYVSVDLSKINIEELNDVKLAVLTYPNYFGETYDIAKVIDYFHQLGIEVLVDEAHGAHFDISRNFPCSSIQYGADYVVQSYHKTLPSLTMSSVIHINKNAVLKKEVYRYLTMLQSSSPSYLLMSSLDQAHYFYKSFKDNLFFIKRKRLIEVLSSHYDVIEMADPLKIFITSNHCSGEEIRNSIEMHHIYTELTTVNGVLLVLPLWHEGDGFPFDLLIQKIQKIRVPNSGFEAKKIFLPVCDGKFTSDPSISYRSIPIEEAVGYCVHDSLIPYPPGIPFVIAGEKLTLEQVEYLKHHPSKIHGMINGHINIIE